MTEYLPRVVEYVRFSSLVSFVSEGGGAGLLIRLTAFVAGGVVAGLFGYKVHKFVIMGGGAVLGALFGDFLFTSFPDLMPQYVWLGAGALLGAGLAYGLFHAALVVLGASAGGLIGWAVAALFVEGPKAGLGAALGIVIGGVAAFVLNRFFVTLFSAAVGAYLLVTVVLVLINMAAPSGGEMLLAHEFIPLSWAVAGMFVAFWFQYRRLPPVVDKAKRKSRRQKKKELEEYLEEDEESTDDDFGKTDDE